MSSTAAGALVGAAICLAAAPYLARLTVTVPDREAQGWWRGKPPGRTRLIGTVLAAAALGALGGAAAGWSVLLPAYVVLALAGAPLTVIDVEHHRLPNRLITPLAAGTAVLLGLAALVRSDGSDYLRAVEAAVVVYMVLYVVHLLGPFGRGDVRLGGILGAYLGWFSWTSVYYGIFGGFVLGTLVSLALLATRRASLKTAIAFGPMLLFGAVVVLAFGLVPNFVR